MTDRRFPLRASRAIYWGIPFFGAAALLFAFELGTDPGLNIGGVIHLGATGARVFYGVLATCSLAFVVLAFLVIAAVRGGRLAVELGDEAIVLPGSPLRPRPRAFRFADVTSVAMGTINNEEFLTLFDARGKGSIARSHVGDVAFDAIVAQVAARVPPPRASLPIAKAL